MSKKEFYCSVKKVSMKFLMAPIEHFKHLKDVQYDYYAV